MTDTRVIVLVGSLRADSLNRRIAETLRAQAPAGVTLEIVDGLAELPFYNEDLDGENVPAASAPCAKGRRRRPRARGHPGVQRHHARGAQQRDRLAVPPVRRRRHQGQAVRRRRRHAHAVRRQVGARGHRPSAGIAGAVVVEEVQVSQSALEVDVLGDPEVFGRLVGAVQALVDYQPTPAAA